jgi:hypothetical protein
MESVVSAFDLHSLSSPLFVLGFRQKQREADRSLGFRARAVVEKIANVNHEEGRMMIAAGGRQRTDG